MSIDLANLVGNTLLSAATGAAPRQPSAVERPGFWRALGAALFKAPARFIEHLERRQAARDAAIRHAIAEGKGFGLVNNEMERAILLTGRADMLLSSHFVSHNRS